MSQTCHQQTLLVQATTIVTIYAKTSRSKLYLDNRDGIDSFRCCADLERRAGITLTYPANLHRRLSSERCQIQFLSTKSHLKRTCQYPLQTFGRAPRPQEPRPVGSSTRRRNSARDCKEAPPEGSPWDTGGCPAGTRCPSNFRPSQGRVGVLTGQRESQARTGAV
jgi:hypothetical protein